MIRNIVGTLIYIGDGRQPPGWAGQVLRARDRSVAAPTFGAEGLYFLGARYPDADGLPDPAHLMAAADAGDGYDNNDVSYPH